MNGAVEKREESLREQARQRQQLVDALAHEMRTPLTTVIGAARMIQNDSAGTELRNEMCDLIVRESRRLSDMDANLMKLTQMNGTEPEMEEFSLAEAAREALEVTPEAVLSGEDSVVTADRALVIHLMRNLVNNALKSGTRTPVRVALHPRGFSVSDEGRGMTEEQIRQCTEPFAPGLPAARAWAWRSAGRSPACTERTWRSAANPERERPSILHCRYIPLNTLKQPPRYPKAERSDPYVWS